MTAVPSPAETALDGRARRAPLDRRAVADPRSTIGWLGALAIALCATAILRLHFVTDDDVAWLLTAAERMVDGAVPYRDIIEPNPPASILLYLPAVLLGRLTRWRSDVAADLLTTALMVASLGGTIRILRRAGLAGARQAQMFWLLALPVALILPLASFSQREHIAVGAIWPILACLAVRARGRAPSLLAVLLAGLGAGVTVAIKPIFALALAGPLIALLHHRRSWRSLLAVSEVWLAGGVAGLYALGVLVLAPDYAARILPLVVDVYLPAHNDWAVLLVLPPFWIWLATAFTTWHNERAGDPFGMMLLLASAGFMACFFIQAKGFPYHSLPAILCADLACLWSAALALSRGQSWRVLALTRLPAIIACVIGLSEFGAHADARTTAPGLIEALEAAGPGQRLLTIGSDSEIGPVLARRIGARWVGSEPVTWVTLYAALIQPQPEADARFAGAIAAEKARYAADIARESPQIVLIEGDAWAAWARRDRALAAALDDYAEAGRYGRVTVLWAKAAARSAAPKSPPAAEADHP